MVDEEDRPAWWTRNQALREALDLPVYEPPRFEDGVYTHAVVPTLERRYDCVIRFVGMDTEYPEDWEVQVDDVTMMAVGRRRDENGNTVYEIGSGAFEQRLVAFLE